MKNKQIYYVEKPSGIALDIPDIEKLDIKYYPKQNRLVLESDLEIVMFALGVLRLNNPEIKFTKIQG